LDELDWRKGQKVVVKKKGKTIVISDWPAQAKAKAGKPVKKKAGKKKK